MAWIFRVFLISSFCKMCTRAWENNPQVILVWLMYPICTIPMIYNTLTGAVKASTGWPVIAGCTVFFYAVTWFLSTGNPE